MLNLAFFIYYDSGSFLMKNETTQEENTVRKQWNKPELTILDAELTGGGIPTGAEHGTTKPAGS